MSSSKKNFKKGKSPAKKISPSVRDPDGYKNFLDRLKQRYTIIYPSPRKFGDYPIAVSEIRNGMDIRYHVNIPEDKWMMKHIQSFPKHFTVPRKTHEIEDLLRKGAYYGNLHQHEITSANNYVPAEVDTTTYECIEPTPPDIFYSSIKETVVGPKKFMIGYIHIPDNVTSFYADQLFVTLRKIDYYKSIAESSESGYREKIEKLQSKVEYKKKKFGLEIIDKIKQGQKLYVPTYTFHYAKKSTLHAIHKYGSILFTTEELSSIIPTTILRISGNQRAEYTLAPITDEYFIQKVLHYIYRSPMEKYYNQYKRTFPVKPNASLLSLIEHPPDIYLPYQHTLPKEDSQRSHTPYSFFSELRKKYASGEIPSSFLENPEFLSFFIEKTKSGSSECSSSSSIEEEPEMFEENTQERFLEYKKYFKSEANQKIFQSIFQAEIKKAIEENPRLKYTGPNEIEPDQRIIELFPSYMHSKRYVPLKNWKKGEEGNIHEDDSLLLSLFSFSRKGKKTYEFSLAKPYVRSFVPPSEEDLEKMSESLTEKEKKLFYIPLPKKKDTTILALFPPQCSCPYEKDMDNAVGYWLQDIPYIYFRVGSSSYRVYLTQSDTVRSYLEKNHQNYPEILNFMLFSSQNEDILKRAALSYSIQYDIRLNGEVIPFPPLSFSSENIYRYLFSKKDSYFSAEEIVILSSREKNINKEYLFFREPPFQEIRNVVDYNLLLLYLSPKNIVQNDIAYIHENISDSLDSIDKLISPLLPLLKKDILFLFSKEEEVQLSISSEKEFFHIIQKGETVQLEASSRLLLKPIYIFWENTFSVCMLVADASSKEYFILGDDTYMKESPIETSYRKIEVSPFPRLHLGKETVLFLFWILHFIYLHSAAEIKNIYQIFIQYTAKKEMDPRMYLLAYFLDYSKILKDSIPKKGDETESFHLKDAVL